MNGYYKGRNSSMRSVMLPMLMIFIVYSIVLIKTELLGNFYANILHYVIAILLFIIVLILIIVLFGFESRVYITISVDNFNDIIKDILNTNNMKFKVISYGYITKFIMDDRKMQLIISANNSLVKSGISSYTLRYRYTNRDTAECINCQIINYIDKFILNNPLE